LSPHSIAIGFVRGKPLASVSLSFGTQHIRTGIGFVRGNRFGGDLACFLDPSPRSCHWVRLVIRLSTSFEARRDWLRSGSLVRERDWLRSGKRCEQSGASRRSIRIVKERQTRSPQRHHRGTPRARSGIPTTPTMNISLPDEMKFVGWVPPTDLKGVTPRNGKNRTLSRGQCWK
jgi:hypothetical protein